MSTLREKIELLSPEKSALLEKHLKNKIKEQQKNVSRISRESNKFLVSNSQRRLWFLSQLDKNSPFYNIPAALNFIGKLNISILEMAINYMISRHEALRTVFSEDQGELIQIVKDNYNYSLPVCDLRTVPEEKREEESRRLEQEEVAIPCDLVKGPIWRALLIQISESKYTFVLSFHHIIFDGWSMGIFVRELMEVYCNLLEKVPITLKKQSLQFVDYTAWHKSYLQGEVEKKQIEYWKKKLDGELTVLELPTDKRRPAVQSFKGRYHSVCMSKALYDSLKKLTLKLGSTMFMITLTALNTLLWRYSAQDEIIIGVPISGRNKEEIENIIGVFVNTVPIRTNLSGDITFSDLLKQVRQTSLDSFENQDIPFEQLVQLKHLGADLSYNPIFQVLFTYQNAIPPIKFDDLEMVFNNVDTGTSKFDLSVDIFEGADGYLPNIVFEYNTDLFGEAKIERMAQNFLQLLESVVQDVNQPISQLDILSEKERQILLHEWNAESRQETDFTMVDLFEEQVNKNSEKTAVVYNDESLTYLQLEEKSNQLAHFLHNNGVEADILVGICLNRSLEMIIAAIGVLKAGGAYVPLDPKYPAERIEYMLEDSKAPILLTSSNLNISELQNDTRLIYIDQILKKREKTKRISAKITKDNIAYVIYTSGTTGKPKGTMVTHGNAVNTFLGWKSSYRLCEDVTSHLQMASFSFDVCTGDIMRALFSGGKLVIAPSDFLLEPRSLYQLMIDEHIDCAEFVPAVLRNLISYIEQKQLSLDFMIILIAGSDSWSVNEYKYFNTFIGKNTRLINSYGLTEATIDSSYFECEIEKLPDTDIVPIGKPFANTSIYILDAFLQLVPIGAFGELYIGGSSVACGYLNNETLTAERFINNPFVNTKSEKMYKTGDLARYMEDGNVELAGRIDNQVKLRGFRIELGEIESVINSYESIKENVVVARHDSLGNNQLAAYIISSDEMFSEEGLRNYLKEILPEYMIPSAFVPLESMPLTSNGKIDRKALPVPSFNHSASDANYVGPRNLIEGKLEGIWLQVFGVPRISVNSNFFHIGGHSLLAMQIITQICSVFQIDVPLQILFKNPTVAGLAEYIAGMLGQENEYNETVDEVAQINPDYEHRYEPFPLTEIQQAYWVGKNDAFELGNVSTHSFDELEAENIDVDRFEAAWNKVIKRHEMLRAIIRDDGIQQILSDVPYYKLKVLDFSKCNDAEVLKGLSSVRDELSHQQLNVAQWPVFDIRISLLPDNKSRIHISTDALLFDAYSYVIIIKDLVMLYENINRILPALDFSFRDYVIGEKSIKKGEKHKKALEYWRERVKNLPPAPELPMVKNPRTLENPKFVRYHKVLNRDIWAKFKKKAMQEGVTATGAVLAVYAEILAAWSKSQSFSINLTFLSRLPLHEQVNDIVGEFTSVTILAVENSHNSTFIERARKIQGNLWNDLEHHDISGVQILRELTRIYGGASEAKMPVVFTSALTVPVPDQEAAPIPFKPIYKDGVTQTSQVWLDCGIWEDTHNLLCNWDVVEDLYPEGFLREMNECFWKLIECLANDEQLWDAKVLSLLSDSQQNSREEWNDTSAPISDEYMHTLFMKQAVIQPEHIAIVTQDKTITYKNLRSITNRLSRLIRELGAKPNQMVAIVMEKGWEQALAALAIQNAGAAYLPIDSDVPKERLDFLIQNCDVSIVLTQSWLDTTIEWNDEVIVIFVDTVDLSKYDVTNLDIVQSQDDLAYTIFTSGSTGVPKGVMISHRGAVNTILDINNRFHVDRNDRVLAISNLNFDLSVYDIFGALAAGATIVIPENKNKLDPIHWHHIIQENGVTLWNSVPQLMSLYAEYIQAHEEKIPESLRLVMMSGDWIPLRLPEQIRELSKNTKIEVISLGGATEASIWSILYPIEKIESHWNSIPYGKPMANQTYHVLNSYLEPCPNWVVGDLYIGGIGLALEYWKDKEKTSKSFIIHPHTGERLYRTGDLGCYMPDGNIEFQGREDNQVKINGYRVELDEIETIMKKYTGIEEVVVNFIGGLKENKSLIGYYILKKETSIDVQELRAFLKEKLPEYLIPVAFMEIKNLPLTPNGKIDRKALPTVNEKLIHTEKKYIAPCDEYETFIAELWIDILKIERIYIHDNFFELGGNSMQAIHMLTEIKENYHIEYSLRDFFAAADIASVATQIKEKE